jgi:hypothetical protein
MAADITVYFKDGTSHVYTNVPDSLTPDEVLSRVNKDFGNIEVEHLGRTASQPVQATAEEDQSSAEAKRLGAMAAEARRPKTLGAKVLKGADDFVRGVADTVTFGFADELAAKADSALKGTEYEDELAAQRQQDEEGGASRTVGQVAGAFIPGTAAVRGAQGLSKAQATARAMGTGGVSGALYGAGSSEATDIGGVLSDAAAGGALGAAGAGLVDKAGNAVRYFANRKELNKLAIPSEVKKQAGALYEQADNLGVAIKPSALQQGFTKITKDLSDAGITPTSPVKSHKEIYEVVQYLDLVTKGKKELSWRDLENIRKSAADVARTSQDPTVRKFVGNIVDGFDDVVENLQPTAFINNSGPRNVAEAMRITRDARQQWKQVSKSEILEELGRKVDAGQITSQRSDTRAIKTALTSLMKNKKQWNKFSQKEKTAIRELAQTSMAGKALNVAEAAQFGSGRLSDIANLGAAVATGGGSLAANASAALLAKGRDKLTQQELDDLVKLIANNAVNPSVRSALGATNLGVVSGLFGGAAATEDQTR